MNTLHKRKFVVKYLPEMQGIKSVHYERYFLLKENDVEIRVQSRGKNFEVERKSISETGEEVMDRYEISQDAFTVLKQVATDAVIRESYILSENPHVSVKIYQGRHKGFVRAEVVFDSKEQAAAFEPYDWMGQEITDSPLGRDSELLLMDEAQLHDLLSQMS